jgi:LPPG:FO 2-phospho-L-lactate transferase
VALRVIALAGGVGGAKLAHGLAQAMPPGDLTVIVNTADDFNHLGLRICPDLDTVMYTLAGLADRETGWGRADESWHCLATLSQLGGPTWFRLGDRDLGLHLLRTAMLAEGSPLSEVVRHISRRLGIEPTVLPMSDDQVATQIETADGWLDFQDYFVARSCEPAITGIRFHGGQNAGPGPGVMEAITAAEVIILCPSNPWVSIDPILTLTGLRPALRRKPVVVVSPIVDGRAIKGPAAKMFRELGIEPSVQAVAEHYRDLEPMMVIDRADEGQRASLRASGFRAWATETVMYTVEDRRRLASELLAQVPVWLKEGMVA